MSIRSTVRIIVLIAGFLVVFPGAFSVCGGLGGLAVADVDTTAVGDIDLAALEILLSWGKHALETNRFSEAETQFMKVLEIDWNNPQAFSLLQKTRSERERTLSRWLEGAETASKAGRWEKALEYYQKILAEEPLHQRALAGAGNVKERRQVDELVKTGMERFIMGDYAAALNHFERALTIDPSDSLAALYAQRAEQETVQSSSLADLRSDGAVWTTYLDALKRFRAGDLSSAETLWRQILDKYPGNEAVLSNLEQVLRRKKGELSAQDMSP